MAAIKGRNTKPELLIRRGLHRFGLRFRLHDRRLPGVPDLVFPKFGAVVFVHGCFWHQHDCHLFKWPDTQSEFWRTKIESNKERDIDNLLRLKNLGWRIAVVWECALKGKHRRHERDVIDAVANWLIGSERQLTIGCDQSTNQNVCTMPGERGGTRP